MAKTLILAGIAFTMLGVVIGAFGAHGLKPHVTKDLFENFQTGVQYHFYHALGLLILGIYIHVAGPSALAGWAGGLFIGGILIFSGSLYLMAITDARWLGAITPIGGTAFIAGWVLWFITVWQKL